MENGLLGSYCIYVLDQGCITLYQLKRTVYTYSCLHALCNGRQECGFDVSLWCKAKQFMQNKKSEGERCTVYYHCRTHLLLAVQEHKLHQQKLHPTACYQQCQLVFFSDLCKSVLKTYPSLKIKM